MTKRRPSNKKPTGVNTSLGNSLVKERREARTSHLRRNTDSGHLSILISDSKNKAKEVKSVTEETSLEEFLAKVELAETDFTAGHGDVKLIESTSCVVPTKHEILSNLELQRLYADRLKIPRRPSKDLWHSGEELASLEKKNFLEWRKGIAELQQVDGLVLTPFERNLELWRQLWRVVERSDVVVQIVDARNPLLFRNSDLEAYVKECGVTKRNVLVINKADLLTAKQIQLWREWLLNAHLDAVFWSAVAFETCVTNNHRSSPSSSSELVSDAEGKSEKAANPSLKFEGIPFLKTSNDLIEYFKTRVYVPSAENALIRPLIVGMVGYPNVGKSSTINRILGKKKVAVSETPGKTRHFQTLIVDDELILCDCPGLVMPSFVFSRAEMIFNGILPADQMREYLRPIALLASRVPRRCFELAYSIMLPKPAEHEDKNRSPTPHELLTTVAFIKGFMSAGGIPDCSRAARLLIKDVVNGKLKWVASPPGISQEQFDCYTYLEVSVLNSEKVGEKGKTVLQQLEKRNLLVSTGVTDRLVDNQFFSLKQGAAHIKSTAPGIPPNIEGRGKSSRRHFNKGKREKLRRVYAYLDA